MLTLEQYSALYPNLAHFASDGSATYQRKSKTGKIGIVRKGKRKNKLALTGGALAGALAGNVIAGAAIVNVVKRANTGVEGQQEAIRKYATLYPGRNVALGLGSLGVIGAGGYLGYKAAKKLTSND